MAEYAININSVIYKFKNCPGAEYQVTGLILGLHPANERRRYKVTPSLIGWAQT